MSPSDREPRPDRSTWGLFDTNPERGMANYAGPQQVRAAAGQIGRAHV